MSNPDFSRYLELILSLPSVAILTVVEVANPRFGAAPKCPRNVSNLLNELMCTTEAEPYEKAEDCCVGPLLRQHTEISGAGLW